MDLDLSFIGAVLRQKGAFVLAKREGIKTEMLEGAAPAGWEFIDNHILEFGDLPSIEFFSAKTGIEVLDVKERADVLVADIRDRALWNKLKGAHETARQLLENNDGHGALECLQEAVRESHRDGITGNKIGSLLGLGSDVLAFYKRMKSGERGVLSPWDAMNQMTLGWWPGDLVVFVARMSVGKTFTLMMLARQAWLDGYKVLFVGTEMSRVKLAMRFYAIHLKLPYKEFRRGQLAAFTEEKMIEEISALLNERGLDVVGDDFEAEIAEIEAAVEQVQPDILFVDGLYLVRNTGISRHERVSNTVDDLKRLARRKNIPIIASSQFNREVAVNTRGAVNAANIGITDVIGWDSDVIFGMYQNEDMREDKMMGFRPLKLREGEGQDFFCKWNFDEMVFDQEAVDSDIESGFDDESLDGIPGISIGDDGWGDDDDGDSGALF